MKWLILLLVLTACTQIQLSEEVSVEEEEVVDIEKPGLETPEKIIDEIVEETEVEDFGEVI